MSFSSRYLLSAVVGLGLLGGLPAQEPARLGVVPGEAVKPKPEVSANQKLADTIADHLRQSAFLQGYQLDVVVEAGSAQLSGSLSTSMQRDEAVRIAQGIPGVERVRDQLTLDAPLVAPVQAVMPPAGEVAPMPRAAPPAIPAVPTPFTLPPEPNPIFQVGYQSPYVLNSPMMPPYAWPTYAPHNNYSRVGYPSAYPYHAWPFIGPPYPFPKVPLGWRKVILEWQDGHWWFGKAAMCYDWWRLRYW